MAGPILDNEPSSLRAGDTAVWNKDLSSDFPATGGWALTYTLTLQSDLSKRLQVAAAANGAAFLMTLTAAQTAPLTVGTYNLFGHVSKAAERYQIFAGPLEVKPDLAVLATGDSRSTVKKTLDAIEAVVLGRAAVDQMSMEIQGRRLDKTPIPDLIALRDKYKALYAQELQAESLATTGINPRRIGVRFTRV